MQRTIYIRILILIFLLLGLISTYIYVYQPFWDGQKGPLSLSYYENTDLFRINPRTILTSLENGNTEIFLPDSRSWDDVYSGPILYNEPIIWSQSDIFKIVYALNSFVWNDNLDDWNLYAMYFNVDCQENFAGLSGGAFQYFKVDFEMGKIVDIWREIYIDPEYAFVAWGDNEKYPHPFLGRKSIDLNGLKITAEDAIRIAEENGGKEECFRYKNNSIHLSLRPESFNGWEADYSTGLEILIDSVSGEVIK